MVVLALGLPPQTFFAGDPGVELIAARHAIATPTRPLQIPLPEIGGEPAPFVDQFFLIHDTHAHAVTPELFPIVSAPFIALFGLRGAYILPALGLLLALASTAWLAVLLDRRRSAVAVLLTGFLGTPLLFYGLEFWEHAVAAGVAALALALFVRASSETAAGPGRLFGIGVLFGIAALLRPEALWFGLAVLVASPLLRSRPSWRQIATTAAGLVCTLVPVELYTLLHFGHLLPPHIAGNPGLFEGDWLATRRNVLATWFFAQGRSSFWRVAPAILLAFVWRPTSYFGGAARRGRPFLLAVAFVSAALVVFSAPNDGGAQWGVRYLLLAYLPLTILATDTLAYVVRFLGTRRRARAGEKAAPRSAAGRAVPFLAVAILAAGSAWLQRSSYKELRGAKLTYARMVDFVAAETDPGRAIVTDLWWLDQSAASLADSRRFFVVTDAAQAAEVLRRLSDAHEPAVTLLRHPVDSPGPVSAWLARSCYSFEREHGSGEGLMAIQLSRTCSR